MITPEKKRVIREALRSLAASNCEAVARFEETITVLSNALELGDLDVVADGPAPHEKPVQSPGTNLPIADRRTFTACWRGRSCFLGNTLLFRLFERLARSPNSYIPHVDLLDDVWDGPREGSTIRGVVKRLRDQLAQHGMDELSRAIDGGNSGHCGLMVV